MTHAHDRDARPACPKCGVTRVHRVTWTIRSQPGEPKFAGPATWECHACGHVWRPEEDAGAETHTRVA